MIPLYHPWTDWQIADENSKDLYAWKWKDNTPDEIKNEYAKWNAYYKDKMKLS